LNPTKVAHIFEITIIVIIAIISVAATEQAMIEGKF
jgi:hypothetical protein